MAFIQQHWNITRIIWIRVTYYGHYEVTYDTHTKRVKNINGHVHSNEKIKKRKKHNEIKEKNTKIQIYITKYSSNSVPVLFVFVPMYLNTFSFIIFRTSEEDEGQKKKI